MVQGRRQGRKLLLLLDYDGTLVEIAPRPELACPTPGLLRLLTRLINQVDYAVVVVSGRPLQNLLKLLAIPGLNYLGSHGGEGLIAGKPLNLISGESASPEISEWKKQLSALLEYFTGWWIEDKPQGFVLHYRQVSPREEDQLLKNIETWKAHIVESGAYQVLAGKKVMEVLPYGVNKGEAIQKILLSSDFIGYFPLYIGDDTTDESVFAVIQEQGLSFKVGNQEQPTKATHFLENPAQVREFLALLATQGEEKT
ncbi:MAG: trehalose-phosphatase [Desulfobaccales bacterium]